MSTENNFSFGKIFEEQISKLNTELPPEQNNTNELESSQEESTESNDISPDVNLSAESDESNERDTAELNVNTDDLLPSKKGLDSNLDIETVFVKSDEPGRKQKIDINYSDKQAIKKAYLEAAGMRKFQKERDTYFKDLTATKKEYEALKKDFDALEKVFAESGAKGLVELLGGEEGWKKAVDDEMAHRDYISNLSAEEKYKLEMKKRDEQYQKQLMTERQQREAFQKQIEEKERMAAVQELESKVFPAFERYRLAGKLGDPEAENFYDEALWSKVRERLKEYPETVALTQAIIDKEFRTVASTFKKHIANQTEKQVSKTIENKKIQTAQKAQVAAKKGLSNNNKLQEQIEEVKSGNFKSVLGSLFNRN